MAELRTSSIQASRHDRATRCISDVFQFLKDSDDEEDGDAKEKRHSEMKHSQSLDTGIKNLHAISNKPDLLADIKENDQSDEQNKNITETSEHTSNKSQDSNNSGWVTSDAMLIKQNNFEHVCTCEKHLCSRNYSEDKSLSCKQCNECPKIKINSDVSGTDNFSLTDKVRHNGEVCISDEKSSLCNSLPVDSAEVVGITSDISSLCRIEPEGCSRSNSPCGLPEGERSTDSNTDGVVEMRRKQNSLEGDDSDSSDEDSGIYNETTRNSRWLMLDDDKHLRFPTSVHSDVTSSSASDSLIDSETTTDNENERVESDVFDGLPPEDLRNNRSHKRTDSTATTASEREFQNRSLVFRRKYFVQRKLSSQEYHRMSTRFYDQEKQILLVKQSDQKDFGLHILDSHPAVITDVEPGSLADKHGIQPGQIVISVNNVNVLESSHDEIIGLMQKESNVLRLEVGMCDVQQARDLQVPAHQGYMLKLGTQPVVKIWSRRFFVLRHDNVLYYYKNEASQDPMGAIPLLNYSISRYVDTKKDNCFKLEKYGARTYYFQTDSREDMRNWVSALRTAVDNSKDRKDSWMDITSHNVGLPALEIKKPECTGFLTKEGGNRKTWRKRYCVLKDGCIYYYKTVNSTSAQGVAHLHGYTVDENTNYGKRNGFTLIPPENTMRTFFFCADNNTDKMRWVNAIKSGLERWIKVE